MRQVSVCDRSGLSVLLVISGLGLSSLANAMDVDFSGFASAVVGRTWGSCQETSALVPRYQDACTRYIADWSHAGVYKPDWSVSPESKVGIQWNAHLAQDLVGVAQVTGRLSPGNKAALEWAYLGYEGLKGWTFQIGRKRLPLYYYSDFQDIGYSYNTIRPSPDVYGWDIVNYNGASARYQTSLGEWSIRQDFFGGSESSKNNLYSKLSYNTDKRVDWSGIRGASLEISNDTISARFTYVQSRFKQVDQDTGLTDVLFSGESSGRHRLYGVALNADLDSWIIRSEFAVADRSNYEYKSKFFLINAGYRIGKFTPTLGFSGYRESTPFVDSYVPVINHTMSAALRYELTDKSDLKVQVDHLHDGGSAPYMGSANTIAVAYDVVF